MEWLFAFAALLNYFAVSVTIYFWRRAKADGLETYPVWRILMILVNGFLAVYMTWRVFNG